MSTIRERLTRRLLISIGLLVLGGGTTIYFITRAALQSEFDTTLKVKAEAFAAMVEQDGAELEVEIPPDSLPGSRKEEESFFQISRKDGAVVVRSSSLGESILLVDGNRAAGFHELELPGRLAGRAFEMPFTPRVSDKQKEEPVSLIVTVASSRRYLDGTLHGLLIALLCSGLLLLAGTALVIPRVLRRELAPLQKLSEQAATIDESSLSRRFPTDNLPGEITPIATRLNELLSRLEAAFERERRFTSDVAHELRTPIAELRSIAELALKFPDARDPGTDEEVCSIALHLQTITAHLLALARGEQGKLVIQPEPVSPTELLEKLRQKYQEKARDKKLDLEVELTSSGFLRTDPVLLRSILENLLENAVEYSRTGTTVQLKVESDSIQVTNTPEDLSAADLPFLFERFWRKDPARQGNGHTGLGLPLSRLFAETLDCRLNAGMDDSGRLTLVLRFPSRLLIRGELLRS